MTDIDNAQEMAKLAIAILNRWGEPAKEGMLKTIDSLYGHVWLYEKVVQIVPAGRSSSGLAHLHGEYFPKENRFMVTRTTGDWTQAELTLMTLVNFLATKDWKEDKPGCVGRLKRVALNMQYSDGLTRVRMMTKHISLSKS